MVHVCDDVACRCAGSEALIAQVKERFGPEDTDVDGASWLRSPCLGQCDRAPAALLTEAGDAPLERELTLVDAGAVVEILNGGTPPEPPSTTPPQQGDPSLRLLRRVGPVDPESLDDYRAHGGYDALRRAIELGPEGVIREVMDSGIVGRGGAAFPMGRKWDAVARQPRRPHYLICNADESEPGTFKDRVLMEGDPFAVVESMTIAAYATGCEQGYLYVRGEYPLARDRIIHAVELARERGFLGPDILGQGFSFDIEVRKGAGAYICGEETAVFGSIEGYRGEPRNKPPFPVVEGLFRHPTVVNNVETLVNVLPIVLEGGPAFAQIGTEKSTGPQALLRLGRRRARPGPTRCRSERRCATCSTWPAGSRATCSACCWAAPPAASSPPTISTCASRSRTRASSAPPWGRASCLRSTTRWTLGRLLMVIAAFMRDESCGQCVPCRVGTVRQEEAVARLLSGQTRGSAQDEIALIREIGQAMRDASICGLGQTASSAIESAIERLGAFTT